jgi:hypothetical protein
MPDFVWIRGGLIGVLLWNDDMADDDMMMMIVSIISIYIVYPPQAGLPHSR